MVKDVELTIVKLVPKVSPNFTNCAVVNPVPVTVTTVPPEIGPRFGLIPEIVGADTELSAAPVMLTVSVAQSATPIKARVAGPADFTVGHGHAQHGREALDVPTVLQTQGLELSLEQFAGLPAGELVAELGGTLAHQLAVKVVVLVHGLRTGFFKEPRFSKPALKTQTIFLSYAYDFWL
jgi:hypothetical protein